METVSGIDSMKVLAIIPARGGSKGVERKNLRPLCGKPLLAYTVETAIAAAHLFCRVVLSTDDEEIASVARGYGLDPPFLRPAALAADETPMLPVAQHATAFVEEHDRVSPDWICILQPSQPFRTVSDLEAAIELASMGGCDSVISVEQVEAGHPILMKRIENGRLLPYCVEEREGTRRQDCSPPAYLRNGAIYLTRRDVLMEQDSIWGDVMRPYVMPADRSVNIDTELDLRIAEILMGERT